MQDMDGNEKFTGLAGRIRDWELFHPRIARPCRYFALLVVVLGVCHWAFNYFDLYHTDADSARYMLSAMVQAQAAIVAIVITLTLIAVQLTASVYSPRVIDVFKKNPDMWILLVIYGASMLYGLIVLKMMVGEVVVGEAREIVSHDVFWVLGYVPMSFECCVSVAYWLQAFTFVALFPYMLNIIGLLEAEAIMQRLVIKITNDKILNSKYGPIDTIMDIIRGTVMKCDIATTGVGLKAVTDRMIEIIDSDGQKKISSHFCAHLERIGKLAVSQDDHESVIKVLESLESFGESTAEKRLRGAPFHAARSLGVVGKIIAENGLEDMTKHVARSLEGFGKLTAENGLGGATFEVTKSLGVILKIVAENGRWDVTKQVAHSLSVVGIVAYNRMDAAEIEELDAATWEAAEHIVKLLIKLSLPDDKVTDKIREIFLGAEQRYIDNEFVMDFMKERCNVEYERQLKELRTRKPD